MRMILSDARVARTIALILCAFFPIAAAAAAGDGINRPEAGAVSTTAHTYTLQDLERQLQATPRLRGRFIQEKHLRDLPQPLVSEGHYVLSLGDGLLWFLEKPVEQALRITPDGIAQRNSDGRWNPAGSPSGRRQDTRLFLAVLTGDTAALQENFDLALSGTGDEWTLTLTPRGSLLRQIFRDIIIRGDTTVRRISLNETQGDRSELILLDTELIDTLTPEEQRAYQH